MMLVSKQQYFEGGRSICRNPILQKMFMRLGRAEKAGSGVDKIVSGWQSLGWPRPIVAEETCPDYVVLTMQLGTKQHKKTRQAGFEEEAKLPITRNLRTPIQGTSQKDRASKTKRKRSGTVEKGGGIVKSQK